jgi:hypothetical protein
MYFMQKALNALTACVGLLFVIAVGCHGLKFMAHYILNRNYVHLVWGTPWTMGHGVSDLRSVIDHDMHANGCGSKGQRAFYPCPDHHSPSLSSLSPSHPTTIVSSHLNSHSAGRFKLVLQYVRNHAHRKSRTYAKPFTDALRGGGCIPYGRP